jgi:uncharacterized protein (TIGR03435 family)
MNGSSLKSSFMSFPGKLFLAMISVAATACPIIVVLHSPSNTWARSQDIDRPQFEAASIKRNTLDGETRFTFRAAPGGRLTVVNNDLQNVILNAYGFRAYLYTGGPDWIRSDHYDIEATAAGNPSRQQMMVMLQALLEDRFKLKVHRETKEMPVYMLTVAKGGPTLEQFKEGSCFNRDPNNPSAGGTGGQPRFVCGNDLISSQGKWEASKIDMKQLADDLGMMVHRKVVDKTGLSGLFNVHMQFTPDPLAADATGPSMFTLVQEQLGLKLESDKGPVEVLVIDRIERPSEN